MKATGKLPNSPTLAQKASHEASVRSTERVFPEPLSEEVMRKQKAELEKAARAKSRKELKHRVANMEKALLEAREDRSKVAAEIERLRMEIGSSPADSPRG
eukprot:jgi/Mesvir1/22794/Mv14180-RA.1